MLQEFETFTPDKWDADDLIQWVSDTFNTTRAIDLLTDAGYEKAKELFSKRRIAVEDWALSRPWWWESFEYNRGKSLADYFIYQPPEITPIA